MNRIKTDLRNRLKTSTLDCLMRISIEGPCIAQFNFERAVDIAGVVCTIEDCRLDIHPVHHHSNNVTFFFFVNLYDY